MSNPRALGYWLRAALVLIVLLASARTAEAEAATVVQLPLGKHVTDVAVAPSGEAWVTAVAGRQGSWAEVGAGGRPRWHRSPARGEFVGLMSARPGGGAWMLRDRHTVVRIDATGAIRTFGGLAVPRGENEYSDTDVHAVTASDGSLVLMGAIGEFLRVAPDGTATRRRVRVPAGPYRDCFARGMVAGPGGSVSVVDLRCSRLLTFSPDGAVKVLQLPHDLDSESGTLVLPAGIAAPADGSLWFGGFRLVGEETDSVFGRVAPDGAVSYLPVEDDLAPTLADAPDGSVWAALRGQCALARVRDGRVERFNAPFRVFELRFAPDGSAWLRGWSRVMHLSAAELEAVPRATRCDTRLPRSTFPDAKHRTMSLATLRRSGLRVRSSQPAEFSGQLRLADRLVYVHKVIRRSGATVSVPLPDALLDRAARRLRAGRRVELHTGLVELRNASGNGQIHTEPYRSVP